jgi:tellurite resistance protein TehA-like permease
MCGNVVADHSHLRRNRKGWRRVLLYFMPSWFSVNMGTGFVSTLLHNLPYDAGWLYWISAVIFALNVVLFLLFLTLSILRYHLVPKHVGPHDQAPRAVAVLGYVSNGLGNYSQYGCVCVRACVR